MNSDNSQRHLSAALAIVALLSGTSVRAQSLIYEADCPVIYAYNVTSGYYVETSLPGGVCSFPANGQIVFRSENSASAVEEPTDACYGNGRYYCFYSEYDWMAGYVTQLRIYDVDTWQLVGSHDFGSSLTFRNGVTYNPADGKLYVLTNVDFDNYLTSIDPTTFEVTQVMQVCSGLYYTTLFAGPDNKIYTLNATDFMLYANDLATGEWDTVGEEPLYFDCYDLRSAVYDFHGNKAYFSCPSWDGVTLFTIDIQNATIEPLAMMPENELLVGLAIFDAPADAPDVATHLYADYPAVGSNECHLSLDMPAQTYGGSALSGALTLQLTIDDVPEELTMQAGEHVSLTRTLANGRHTISVRVGNEAGLSPERRLLTFAGTDVPAAVRDLTCTFDPATAQAHLTWKAPTTSQYGGIFDASSITYTVVRNPNHVVLAEGLTECTFTDQLDDAYARYSYTVIPFAGNDEGVAATTEPFAWGNQNVPPFCEDFEDYEGNQRWTQVNCLEDGLGWSIYGSAQAFHNGEVDNDYYLFSPQIRLDAQQTYTLSFDASAGGWYDLLGRLQVSLARQASPEGIITPLMEELTLREATPATYYADFQIAESGTYYLCFHDLSPRDGTQSDVDNVTMTINSLVSAPASVSALTLTSLPKGAGVNLSFQAPSTMVDGSQLTSLSRIEVIRIGQETPVHIFESPAPGAQLACDDITAPSGSSTYAITAYTTDAKGMTLHALAYVGLDAPLEVQQLAATQPQHGQALLTWQVPAEVGGKGGYVDLDALTYNVRRWEDLDGYYAQPLAQGLTTLSYLDQGVSLSDRQPQTLVRYQVQAVNNIGEGPMTDLYMNVGTPYALPFAENFAQSKFHSSAWYSRATQGKASWQMTDGSMMSVQPYFADHGMMQFSNQSFAPSEAILYLPRVDMSSEKAATLVFYMYHGTEAEPEDLCLTVRASADDAPFVELQQIAYNDGTIGWQRHEVSLQSLQAKDNVWLQLVGYAYDNSASLFVDDLTVGQQYGLDLELSHAAFPASIQAGHTVQIDVLVSNAGMETSASATLQLLKQGISVAEAPVAALQPGEQQTISMELTADIAEAYDTLFCQAVIVCDADQNASNDASAIAPILAKGNTLPTLHITAQKESEQIVLSWEAPTAEQAVPLTDSFEDYSPYALSDFGPWIAYDGDQTMTYWLRYWPSVGNPWANMAFEVWNTDQLFADGFYIDETDVWPNHSGSASLISFTAITDPITWDTPMPNDNWLIAPSVVGGTDVSYWVTQLSTINTEYFELLYSEEPVLDNPDPSTYTVLRRDSTDSHDWKLITATLPREATSFAIRYCTEHNSYIIMLDDVTYTPDEGSQRDITSRGYNVYRDGQLVATVGDCRYVDTEATPGQHTYYVTSLWEEGESTISNRVTVDVTAGLQQLTMPSASRPRYDLWGRIIPEGVNPRGIVIR